jgi:20S proteasome subunit alpha 7
VIALKAKDGVVLAVEKLVSSKLYESGANRRIFNIDRHIGVAVAGLIADARAVLENAREEARSYRRQYGQPIPVKV